MRKRFWVYGMRLRGFSPGCQPMKGLIERKDAKREYYDILVYDRELSDKELRDYELDFLYMGFERKTARNPLSLDMGTRAATANG